MSSYVFAFSEVDGTDLRSVGGKGANLGALSKIPGLSIPPGFCVSAEAFQRVITETRSLHKPLAKLSLLKLEEWVAIRELSTEIRERIHGVAIPHYIQMEVSIHLSDLGERDAYAVRSSATAEDLPTASFAGQQDTYLNISGTKTILEHINKCWASLYTERAVTYRIQNGFDHSKVHMAVVIQKMIFPQTAGILFTADPVTGNRKVSSMEASFGLGEALVSGLVDADIYKTRAGEIIEKRIATKKLALYPAIQGGTQEQQIDGNKQREQALSENQILQLERIGRKIEAHFGCPQDIEWCFLNETFFVLQSRPITTLFPIPSVDDQAKHVFVSVGHQQMMTDPLRPLGLSFFRLITGRPLYAAGGRLFVDIVQELASPIKRHILVDVLGKSDPLLRDAMLTVLKQGYIAESATEAVNVTDRGDKPVPATTDFQALKDYDPQVIAKLIKSSQDSIAELKMSIQTKSGAALMDFILDDIASLRRMMSDPQSIGVIMTAMNAASWLNENIMEWLGEANVADILSQSVPNNVTSQMGLELLDVADVIRSHPEVVHHLRNAKNDSFLDDMVSLKGGRECRAAIDAYLDKYGMRCAGEIDITRPRWSEAPLTIVPMILSNIASFEANAGSMRFERGRDEALNKEAGLLERLALLPEGQYKVNETRRMIRLVRSLSGYREYPKYGIVSRYFVYKQALLREAERLVRAGVIREREDIYYLAYEELQALVNGEELDFGLINQRKEEHKVFEKLTPPRLFTSDGEVVVGEYKRDNLPAHALVGLPVSSGTIEGRARVILKLDDAVLEDGDILVTSFTDPGWTLLFVSIKGLVTEVGGLMTHGAVIAREYGIPAVVGVENATKLIKDGQRIRVYGTEGYIEMLE